MSIGGLTGILALVVKFFDFLLVAIGILYLAMSGGETAAVDRLSGIALIALGIGVRVLKVYLKKRKNKK